MQAIHPAHLSDSLAYQPGKFFQKPTPAPTAWQGFGGSGVYGERTRFFTEHWVTEQH